MAGDKVTSLLEKGGKDFLRYLQLEVTTASYYTTLAMLNSLKTELWTQIFQKDTVL